MPRLTAYSANSPFVSCKYGAGMTGGPIPSTGRMEREGWVVEHGETLLVPEAENDPRVRQANGAQPQTVRSVIALPLRGRKGTHGAIEIFNPRADQLNDYTIAFLHILADHAAIAIENAHDVARIQQLTITDDCTGLYNVRHLYEVLGRELEHCSRKRPVSLAFHRPGPLQDGERPARPPGGQRAAGQDRLAAPGVEPQAGLVLPLWR